VDSTRPILVEAQASLEKHFAALARERKPHSYPVYALEHGFEPKKIDELRHELCRSRTLDDRLWLVWVIIATEIGYTYDGDEYWHSFVKGITSWPLFGDRNRIRDWFAKFGNLYNGFRPCGRWAKHFSIIAWPITHAILPRDLQGQFARHLYDLRYQLAIHTNAPLEELGQLLKGSDSLGSSRFQHFLDQSELTARLALAFRDEDVQGTASSVFRPTLARIIRDLEGRQAARDWFRDTRKVLRDARFGHISALLANTDKTQTSTFVDSAKANNARLIARQSSNGSWQLGLILPDVRQILEQVGVPTKILDGKRIKILGETESWMPARALLTLSGDERAIESFDHVLGTPALITLEQHTAGLSEALTAALQLKGTSPWLLKVQDDGVARQLLGNFVRTKNDYIIATTDAVATHEIKQLQLVHLDTNTLNVFLYHFHVPTVLGPADLVALKAIKLGYSLRAEIEPVGLVPRWDGSAECSVWLSGEQPMVRLSADHPVSEFTLTVDQSFCLRIPVAEQRHSLVSLGQLAPGPHIIEVTGTTIAKLGASIEAETFHLYIRAPEPWVASIRDKAGFRAVLEPAGASLDGVLAGMAKLSLLGPSERSVIIGARLFDVNGHQTEHLPLGSMVSLSNTGELQRILLKLAKEPDAEKVQTSPRVDLTFLVDELGFDSVSFNRTLNPLRWRLNRNAHDSSARLIDEAGKGDAIRVTSYSILEPDKKIEVNVEDYLLGKSVDPPGLLLNAESGNKRYTAIFSVPPRQPITSLSNLGVKISISPSKDTPRNLPHLLSMLRLWFSAKQVLGPLGGIRKADVCKEFNRRIESILCGVPWADRVRQSHSLNDPVIQQLRNSVGGSPGFVSRIMTTNWDGADQNDSLKDEFVRIAGVYHICEDVVLCGLALRVAFAPETIRPSADSDAITEWQRLMSVPSLVKGAFLARLVTRLRGQASASGVTI
jgi:hypothetical protein